MSHPEPEVRLRRREFVPVQFYKHVSVRALAGPTSGAGTRARRPGQVKAWPGGRAAVPAGLQDL